MQGGLTEILQTLAPILASLMMFAALYLLWSKSRSIWLIIAMVAELGGLAFMVTLRIAPGLLQDTPFFFAIWTLTGFVMALALLAYAVEVSQRPSA